MNIPPKVLADARARRDWIKEQLLQTKGLRLIGLAQELKISSNAVSQGLLGTSLAVERAVCEHLGLAHPALFPERYADNGALKTLERSRPPMAA
jgi:lambda repressor-like predicted transcriptional regulator